METLDNLAQLAQELDEHMKRLKTRASAIEAIAAQQTDPALKELISMIAEAFTEQVDTGLDFQRETIAKVIEALEQVGGDDELGIFSEDADKIVATLTEYRAMLDEVISRITTPTAERTVLQAKLENCIETIALVEGITLDDEGDEPEAGDEPARN